MRTKALLLGCQNVPIEGSWVPINDAQGWRCRVVTQPDGVSINGELRLDVQLSDGRVVPSTVRAGVFAGHFVRVVIEKQIEGLKNISIFAEESLL